MSRRYEDWMKYVDMHLGNWQPKENAPKWVTVRLKEWIKSHKEENKSK